MIARDWRDASKREEEGKRKLGCRASSLSLMGGRERKREREQGKGDIRRRWTFLDLDLMRWGRPGKIRTRMRMRMRATKVNERILGERAGETNLVMRFPSITTSSST